MSICKQCELPIVETILSHHNHIEQTDFDDISQWYWLDRCQANHYSKTDKAVSKQDIKNISKYIARGNK